MRRLQVLAAAAVFFALSAAPAGAASPLAVVHVAGDADPWTATGVVVTAGDILEISAHGQAITGPLSQYPGARSGPDGQSSACFNYDNGSDPGPDTDCALDFAPYGALVGRVDGGTPFVVGSAATIVATGAGELQLAVNDNLTFYSDNSGGYAVRVTSGS